MDLFENKVGRPSNEILRKRKKFYAISSLAIVGIIGVGVVLFSGKNFGNLLGAVSTKPQTTVNNITADSFVVNWKAKSSYKAESLTIYTCSDKNCKSVKKFKNYKIMANKQNGSYKVKGLKSNTYYLTSIKYKILNSYEVVNSKPIITKSYYAGITISNITKNSFKFNWKSSIKASSYTVYNYDSENKLSKLKSGLVSKNSGSKEITGLKSGTRYLVSVKFSNGRIINKEVKTEATTTENATTSETKTITISDITSNGYTFSWKAEDNVTATKYTVYEVNSSNKIGKSIGFGTINSNSVTVSNTGKYTVGNNYAISVKFSDGKTILKYFQFQ